jgi:hypothetical protein
MTNLDPLDASVKGTPSGCLVGSRERASRRVFTSRFALGPSATLPGAPHELAGIRRASEQRLPARKRKAEGLKQRRRVVWLQVQGERSHVHMEGAAGAEVDGEGLAFCESNGAIWRGVWSRDHRYFLSNRRRSRAPAACRRRLTIQLNMRVNRKLG